MAGFEGLSTTISIFPLVIEGVAVIASVVMVGLLCLLKIQCRRCLLFGKVLEVKRILTGDAAWCAFCIILGILTSSLGIYLVCCVKLKKIR